MMFWANFWAEICLFIFFMILPHFLRFSLIFMNMQIRWFTNLTTGKRHVSNI